MSGNGGRRNGGRGSSGGRLGATGRSVLSGTFSQENALEVAASHYACRELSEFRAARKAELSHQVFEEASRPNSNFTQALLMVFSNHNDIVNDAMWEVILHEGDGEPMADKDIFDFVFSKMPHEALVPSHASNDAVNQRNNLLHYLHNLFPKHGTIVNQVMSEAGTSGPIHAETVFAAIVSKIPAEVISESLSTPVDISPAIAPIGGLGDSSGRSDGGGDDAVYKGIWKLKCRVYLWFVFIVGAHVSVVPI